MLLNLLYLIVGLLLILVGATGLTDGSATLARRLGVTDMVIGLTVVAFGTSAPELAISILSACHNSAELAIGNVVGSNIFNVCAIIGITALVKPIKLSRSVMVNEIPLIVLSALALLVMGNGPLLNGGAERVLTRMDGLILLLFFLIFMRYTFAEAKTATSEDPAEKSGASYGGMSVWKSVLYVILGLAGLIVGGEVFVNGATGVAKALGVSDAIIGLTIVAMGTSLPELATAIVAALRGHSDMAVGNVIGSNIFNIFLVAGCTATITPLTFGSIGNVDLLMLTGSCLLFWLFGGVYGKRTIMRVEGAILLISYIAYMIYLI